MTPEELPGTPKLEGRSRGTCTAFDVAGLSAGISITSRSGEELRHLLSDLKA